MYLQNLKNVAFKVCFLLLKISPLMPSYALLNCWYENEAYLLFHMSAPARVKRIMGLLYSDLHYVN